MAYYGRRFSGFPVEREGSAPIPRASGVLLFAEEGWWKQKESDYGSD
jgi:hypothetical protein